MRTLPARLVAALLVVVAAALLAPAGINSAEQRSLQTARTSCARRDRVRSRERRRPRRGRARPGRRAGLGLAIVDGIVRAHAGRVSAPGGACFVVGLPAAVREPVLA